MRILAGDIGGTNTRLAVYDVTQRRARPALVSAPAKYKNAQFTSVQAILADFLSKQAGELLTDACFGVAGPVEERRVQLTNVPEWPPIDADALARQLEIPVPARVNLLNDMSAHASSVATVEQHHADAVIALREGRVRETGAQAIVMPGTGLGIGAMIWDAAAGFHRPIPSEGCHEDLSARDESEDRLVDSLRRLCMKEGLGRATRELAVSGPGLRAIYACLRDPERPTLEGVPAAEDLAALESGDVLVRQTLDMFTSLLGAICGNVALGFLATAGVYLAGSICTSLSSRMQSRRFVDAFEQTGPARLRPLVASIPVRLLTLDDTGLLGAATFAANVSPDRH